MKKLIAVFAVVAVFGLATAEAANLVYDVPADTTVIDSDDHSLGSSWVKKKGPGTLIMTGNTSCAAAYVADGTMVLSGSGSIVVSSYGILIGGDHDGWTGTPNATFLVDAGATFNPGADLYQRITLTQGTIGGSGTFNIHGAYFQEPDDTGSYNDAPVTVGADRTIAPGMPGSPGTMTIDWIRNGLDFAEGGTYAWDLDGTTGDLLDVSNLSITATSGDPFNIDLYTPNTSWDPSVDHTWTIATGGIGGFSADKFVIDASNFTGADPGATWSVTSASDMLLHYTAPLIPEPAGLGLMGVALLALRRRRS